jgi:IS605 OrfB family transposase
MQLTYRYRVKDKHAARLNTQKRGINLVWNFCNETQQKAIKFGLRWPSGNDLWKLVAGVTKEGLDLHSHSAMRVCKEYAKARQQHRKRWLRWRGRRSLGWIPFNTGHVAFRDGGFVFRGERYEVWLHRPLPEGATIGAGSFSQDSRGHWYINCPVKVEEPRDFAPVRCIGVDLGLKYLAVLSTGEKIEMPAFYRRSEQKLGTMQRARKSKRARAIHHKVANRRRDFLHQKTARLVKEYGLIIVGNVSPKKLSQTRMAKSVLDAGWSRFKDMLAWKLRLRSAGMFLEVSERLSTQTCSDCGAIGGPRGLQGLRIREWMCDGCGTVHDRDVNGARNILRVGLDTLVAGASS